MVVADLKGPISEPPVGIGRLELTISLSKRPARRSGPNPTCAFLGCDLDLMRVGGRIQ